VNELLAALDDIGELARLLSVFSNGQFVACGHRELVQMVRDTAGVGARLPRPESAIPLALHLGLLKKKTNLFELTSVGQAFVRTTAAAITDFTDAQAKLLLGLLGDDAEFLQNAKGLLARFQRRSDGSLSVRSAQLSIDSVHATTAQVLHRLGALRFETGELIIRKEYEVAISESFDRLLPATEEQFWKQLDERRLRAREVEERVVREEGHRLEAEGRRDLVPAVMRISAIDPGSDYDIRSFNRDGSDRFIEVKSSVGNRLAFLWSDGERRLALAARDSYWIYFVPLAQLLPADYCPVLMIRDPIGYIEAGALVETPASFRVTSSPPLSISRVVTFSREVRLFEWRPKRARV
jgi:hypothetical protein